MASILDTSSLWISWWLEDLAFLLPHWVSICLHWQWRHLDSVCPILEGHDHIINFPLLTSWWWRLFLRHCGTLWISKQSWCCLIIVLFVRNCQSNMLNKIATVRIILLSFVTDKIFLFDFCLVNLVFVKKKKGIAHSGSVMHFQWVSNKASGSLRLAALPLVPSNNAANVSGSTVIVDKPAPQPKDYRCQ